MAAGARTMPSTPTTISTPSLPHRPSISISSPSPSRPSGAPSLCHRLCLSMWGQKICGVPIIATALIVGGYNMGLIPIYTFTAIIGFFAVLLCIGLAFFSVLIGSRRSPRVQELCMLVGAGAPVVFSIIYVCIADFTLFRMGLTLSVISSFINIFFNKLSASVGVPLKHSMVRPSENNLAAAWGNSFTHTAQAQ